MSGSSSTEPRVWLARSGNDGEEQVRWMRPPSMNPSPTTKDLDRAVVRIGVDARARPAEGCDHRLQAGGVTRSLEVLALDRARHLIAGRDDDRGRPDFNIELVHLARQQELTFVVSVVRTVRRRQGGIELAMRGAEPALGDGRVGVERPLEVDLTAIRREDAERDKEIGVDRR